MTKKSRPPLSGERFYRIKFEGGKGEGERGNSFNRRGCFISIAGISGARCRNVWMVYYLLSWFYDSIFSGGFQPSICGRSVAKTTHGAGIVALTAICIWIVAEHEAAPWSCGSERCFLYPGAAGRTQEKAISCQNRDEKAVIHIHIHTKENAHLRCFHAFQADFPHYTHTHTHTHKWKCAFTLFSCISSRFSALYTYTYTYT